ncbi:hypothetical protein [Streptomyces abikoensis]|uniref:hypothetical protein n=1 Tax=Streptomyces abikoensis TaxID=97398 RepID=UPI001677ED34|nr:hypothetical protein [Streptomyces abikoensis]GGP39767.1 hypothetical protein GCM10010214_11350 [Streptomyces abikoensis]
MRLKPEISPLLASVLLGTLTLTALTGLTGCADLSGRARPGAAGAPDTGPPDAGGTAGTVDLGARITGFTDGINQNGHYRVPAASDRRAVADGVRLLVDGDRAAAERSLVGAGYALRTLADRQDGRRYAEIADATREGETTRGWGRVYLDLQGPARWSVQVPHPSADQRTEQLGIGLLRGAPGGVLILAGAHRNAAGSTDGDAADVAHRADSVFAAVAAVLADRRLPAVQVHGFADASLPEHDVVVSPGKGDAGLPAARRLSAALGREKLRVCEVWRRYCGRLEGRTNVEGDHADAVGAPFLHVEHSRTVRFDDALMGEAVRALTEVVRRWSAGRA